MQALLGIVPPDDARGCLQDIHWYDGAVRLFPELHAGRHGRGAAHGRRPPRRATGWTPRSAAASSRPLLAWLRQRVHGQGSRLGFNDLLRAATGKPLDPGDFEAHLTRRYLQG